MLLNLLKKLIFVAKYLVTKETPDTVGPTGVFYKIFQEEIAPNLLSSIRKMKKEYFSSDSVKLQVSLCQDQTKALQEKRTANQCSSRT